MSFLNAFSIPNKSKNKKSRFKYEQLILNDDLSCVLLNFSTKVFEKENDNDF